MLTINSFNSLNFNGKIRYVYFTPESTKEIYDIAENRVPRKLVDFSEKSAFLNKLKENKDVLISHYRDLNKTFAQPEKKGFFSKLFSKPEPKIESPRIGTDYISVTFENKPSANLNDIELCTMHVMMPVNKGTPDNFDRFERVFENNSNIDALRAIADRLFPKDSHKITPLPNNSEFGYCEFWTGRRTADDTLNKLYAISKAEIKSLYEQFNQNIINKTFGF